MIAFLVSLSPTFTPPLLSCWWHPERFMFRGGGGGGVTRGRRRHMRVPHGSSTVKTHWSYPGPIQVWTLSHLCQARCIIRAASFLLKCSVSCSLCALVDPSPLCCVFLRGLLWSEDELLLSDGGWAWSLTSDVASLWLREEPTLMRGYLFLSSLACPAEEAAVEAADATELDRSPALGAEGGVGFRLEPAGEKSFSSPVCCDATGGEWSSRREPQLRASGASCRSAAVLLLKNLLLWAAKVALKASSVSHLEDL